MWEFCKGRKARIVLGILLPPLFGVIVFLVPTTVDCVTQDQNELACGMPRFLVISAYLLMGLPSIIYSLVMEFVVNSKISSYKICILVSSFLGVAAGMVTGKLFLVVVGAIVGLLTGMILRKNYENDLANKRTQQTDLPTSR